MVEQHLKNKLLFYVLFVPSNNSIFKLSPRRSEIRWIVVILDGVLELVKRYRHGASSTQNFSYPIKGLSLINGVLPFPHAFSLKLNTASIPARVTTLTRVSLLTLLQIT